MSIDLTYFTREELKVLLDLKQEDNLPLKDIEKQYLCSLKEPSEIDREIAIRHFKERGLVTFDKTEIDKENGVSAELSVLHLTVSGMVEITKLIQELEDEKNEQINRIRQEKENKRIWNCFVVVVCAIILAIIVWVLTLIF